MAAILFQLVLAPFLLSTPVGAPVSARQTAYDLIEALSKGNLPAAKALGLTGQEYASLSRRDPDPQAYDKNLDAFLQSLRQELSAPISFKDAVVADVLILPESPKTREVVLAVVHVSFVHRDGKPLGAPIVFSFVKLKGEWKFLLR